MEFTLKKLAKYIYITFFLALFLSKAIAGQPLYKVNQ